MGQNIPDYTLDHPEVQEAKKAYQKAHPVVSAQEGMFERLFALFKQHASFVEIARKVGTSRLHISKAYAFFRPFCENKSHRERRSYTEARVRAQKRLTVEKTGVPPSPQVRLVMNKARELGYRVDMVAHYVDKEGMWMPYKRLLRINWRICAVMRGTGFFSNGHPSGRAVFHVSQSVVVGAEAVIFLVETEGKRARFFIVPSSVVAAAYFEGTDRTHTIIAFSLKKRKRWGGPSSRVDYLEYEDRWDVLADDIKKAQA